MQRVDMEELWGDQWANNTVSLTADKYAGVQKQPCFWYHITFRTVLLIGLSNSQMTSCSKWKMSNDLHFFPSLLLIAFSLVPFFTSLSSSLLMSACISPFCPLSIHQNLPVLPASHGQGPGFQVFFLFCIIPFKLRWKYNKSNSLYLCQSNPKKTEHKHKHTSVEPLHASAYLCSPWTSSCICTCSSYTHLVFAANTPKGGARCRWSISVTGGLMH